MGSGPSTVSQVAVPEYSDDRPTFRHANPNTFSEALRSIAGDEIFREQFPDYNRWQADITSGEIIQLLRDVRDSLEQMNRYFKDLVLPSDWLIRRHAPLNEQELGDILKTSSQGVYLAGRFIDALRSTAPSLDPKGHGIEFAKMLWSESNLSPNHLNDFREALFKTLIAYQKEPTATNEERSLGIERLNKLELLLHIVFDPSADTEVTP